MAEKKIITKERIADYQNAVIKFNENIKKEKRHRQTLCENFIADWAEVIEEINIKNRKEINK